MPHSHEYDDGNLLLETAKPKVEVPKRYQVVLLNDDYTPMDFVVDVLQHFFWFRRAESRHDYDGSAP